MVPLQRAEFVLVKHVGQVAGPVGKTMAGGEGRPGPLLQHTRGGRVLVLFAPKPSLDSLGGTFYRAAALGAMAIVTIATTITVAVVAAVVLDKAH